MKKILIVFTFLTASLSAQEVQILSAKDSVPVPFAHVALSNGRWQHVKTATEQGRVPLQGSLSDTAMYNLVVSCFGYLELHRTFSGKELKNLDRIYLQPSAVRLDEVVVTAQYEPVNASQSVQRVRVIDSEKIRQMAAVNLRDVMSNQLNVRLQQDNILGSSLNVQGVGGQNVKILIDGIPMIGRQNGNLDLTQINMNNVERIEFIEGPLSVQYGTNALAGTINIITKKPKAKRLTAGLSSYYESIGTYNETANLSFSNKRHNVQVNGGRNYFDGWSPGDKPFSFPKTHLADSSRFQQWKPKEQYFVSGGYQYSFKKLEIGVQSSYFNEHIKNRGYPRGPYGEDAFDDRYYTQRLDNSISLKGKIAESWSVNGLAAFNYYKQIKETVYKDLTTLDETLSLNSSDLDTSRFTQSTSRASFVHTTGSRLNYELGYDLNYQTALDKRIEGELKDMGDYALFATTEYRPVNNLVLKPGLRYAYNTVYKTPVIPSLNIKWSFWAGHTLRASYARGFRAPDLKELYFLFVDINHNIIGNPNLKAEQSDNFNLSYNYTKALKKCTIKGDASFFYNNIFNLITLAPINNVQYAYINVGRYKTQGLQLGGTMDLKQLTVQVGFNYTGRYNNVSETANISKFSYSPELLLNSTYRFTRIRASASLFYKYNGRLPGFALTSDKEVVPTFISAYSMMDLTFNKFLWKEQLNISLGCKNMFNVKNISTSAAGGGIHSMASTSTALSTGRTFFIKLTFNFSKA